MTLQHRCPLATLAVVLAISAFGPATRAADQNAPACRTYSAAATRVDSSGGGASETCDYNTSTNVMTCTLDVRQAGAYRVVSVRQFASVSDFVDEVRVIPPISRATGGSTTYSPTGPGAQNSRLTLSYDVQRRQTEMLFQFADGRSSRSVYSAWDPSGRPAVLTTSGQTIKYAYDDAKRVMTITNATAGGLQTHTFDANGNLIREVVAPPPGGPASTTTITITKTAQVCR